MPITAKKQTKLKEHEIKTGTKKKKREAKPDRTEKNQIFITVRNTKISGVFKRTNFTAIGKRGTLFVTRWLQVVTISYLTDSFEIIIMPKEMFFLARLWQINSKVVFLIFALKRKEILGFSGVTKR